MTKVSLRSLTVNLSAERDGDWQDAALIPGVSFKVRSTNYAPYVAARSKALQEIQKKYPTGDVPPDETAAVFGGLLADHLLLDWRGFDADYSPDEARAVLTDETFRPLREAVATCAAMVGQRDIEFVEDAAKN